MTQTNGVDEQGIAEDSRGTSITDSYAHSRRKKLAVLAANASMAAAVCTLAFAFIGLVITKRSSPALEKLQNELMAITASNADFQRSLEATSTELERASIALKALQEIPETAKLHSEIGEMRSQLASLDRRLRAFEAAAAEDPERILSVPLLRLELSHLKQSQENERRDFLAQVDRVYEQNNWFIGLMLTMAIGLVGLAVSNLVQVRRR